MNEKLEAEYNRLTDEAVEYIERELNELDCPHARRAFTRAILSRHVLAAIQKAKLAFSGGEVSELQEANGTIAMLAQKVADQKEIIRKLTS